MDQFAKLLATHRSLTEDTWALLADRGVDDQTPLILDFRYEAPNRAKAHALTSALVELSEQVRLTKSGTFFRPHWTVTGALAPRTFDQQSLVGWVEMMCLLGRQFESHFDGFGTTVDGLPHRI